MAEREQPSSLIDIEEVERMMAEANDQSKLKTRKPTQLQASIITKDMYQSNDIRERSPKNQEKTFQVEELDDVLRELDKLEGKVDESVVNQGNTTKNNQAMINYEVEEFESCLLYTSPSPRDS
eukprot:TRINITY_DN12922_c0_g4_i2.p1 TRINITY_DN12922_c0_g4~~TRINITY_DN12922_c0_g4_i2.p1  ORF type:complete len:123 (+),score=27.71 TRINITY_DN12922_c0_g4_i2:77-445(+)